LAPEKVLGPGSPKGRIHHALCSARRARSPAQISKRTRGEGGDARTSGLLGNDSDQHTRSGMACWGTAPCQKGRRRNHCKKGGETRPIEKGSPKEKVATFQSKRTSYQESLSEKSAAAFMRCRCRPPITANKHSYNVNRKGERDAKSSLYLEGNVQKTQHATRRHESRGRGALTDFSHRKEGIRVSPL